MKIAKTIALFSSLAAYSALSATPFCLPPMATLPLQTPEPLQEAKKNPSTQHESPYDQATANPVEIIPSATAEPLVLIPIATLTSEPQPETKQAPSGQYEFPQYNQSTVSPTEKIPSSAVELPYQDKGFHLTAQFLYWQTLEDNLLYAINQPPHADPISLEGEIKKNGYRWDPGVRAGLGYIFSPDTWDINFEYTYFHNGGGRSGAPKNGETWQGLFPDLLPGLITRINSQVNLQYHTIDLTMTHAFHTTPSFLMRFSIGGRGAWISQGWNVAYKSQILLNPFPAIFLETNVKNSWHFAGGGIRAGLLLDWFIMWGFSLHFEGMASALLGQYNNLQRIDQNTGLELTNTEPKNKRIVPNYQLQLGIDWRLTTANYGFKVFAAWEINMWSRLSQVFYYPATTLTDSKVGGWSRDSINIQGLTTGFVFEF